MTTIIIIFILFIIAAIVMFVFNKSKEKAYENTLSEDVLKTKKIYKGSLTRYIDNKEEKTILRYFISKKTNTLSDFIPTKDMQVGKSLILFDKNRRKVAIIRDIENHGVSTVIPFSDIISLQPVEISKKKRVTRGGISPISIKGYRWVSSTTRTLKQVERVYIEIRYKAYGKEKIFELNIFEGLSYEDGKEYSKVVDKVNNVINVFHEI